MTAEAALPRVDVIVPVHNHAEYLPEAIESALAQEGADLDVLVIDDGSEDGSAEVARGFEPHVRVESQPRAGSGAARNRGVAASDGAFIAFLDADDRFAPGKLAAQLEAFAADPSLEAVFGHVREFVSPELDAEATRSVRAPSEPGPSHLASAMLIRRESFERVGPFATDLMLRQGVDWYARSRDAGLREAMLGEVVLERRLHATNSGLRESGKQDQYMLSAIRAALDRRRGQASP